MARGKGTKQPPKPKTDTITVDSCYREESGMYYIELAAQVVDTDGKVKMGCPLLLFDQRNKMLAEIQADQDGKALFTPDPIAADPALKEYKYRIEVKGSPARVYVPVALPGVERLNVSHSVILEVGGNFEFSLSARVYDVNQNPKAGCEVIFHDKALGMIGSVSTDNSGYAAHPVSLPYDPNLKERVYSAIVNGTKAFGEVKVGFSVPVKLVPSHSPVDDTGDQFIFDLRAKVFDINGNLKAGCDVEFFDEALVKLGSVRTDNEGTASFPLRIPYTPKLKEARFKIQIAGTLIHEWELVKFVYPARIDARYGSITENGGQYVVPLIAVVYDVNNNLKAGVEVRFFGEARNEIGRAITNDQGIATCDATVALNKANKKVEYEAVVNQTGFSAKITIENMPLPKFGAGFWEKAVNRAINNATREKSTIYTGIIKTTMIMLFALWALNSNEKMNYIIGVALGILIGVLICRKNRTVGVIVGMILALPGLFVPGFYSDTLTFAVFWSFFLGGPMFLLEIWRKYPAIKEEGNKKNLEWKKEFNYHPWALVIFCIFMLLVSLLGLVPDFSHSAPMMKLKSTLPPLRSSTLSRSFDFWKTVTYGGGNFRDVCDWLFLGIVYFVYSFPAEIIDIVKQALGLARTGGVDVSQVFVLKEWWDILRAFFRRIFRRATT